jgi:hypothetical protein
VTGHVAIDTFRLSSFSPILKFGIGLQVSSDFNSYPMDGILGVGRGDNVPNSIEAPGIMDVLFEQRLIKSKSYGVALSRTSDGLHDGELNFGAPNKARYDGDLNYLSLVPNTNGFWQIPLDDVLVDGKALGFQGRSTIIDSGTSFILMPQSDAVALHKLLPNSVQNDETFHVPCTTKTSLQFVFNKIKYSIAPADYVGPSVGDGKCRTNIIGRQVFGIKEWLVGDVFLKNVYAVFDFEGPRMGLGVKKGGHGDVHAASSAASKGVSSTAAAVMTTTGKCFLLFERYLVINQESLANLLCIGTTASVASSALASETASLSAESQQRPGASPASKGNRLSPDFLSAVILVLSCFI